MLEINFAHEYHKLDDKEFTTIRGLSYLNKIPREVRSRVARIKVKREHRFNARILYTTKEQVKNLELKFLKKDAEYPGFILQSKEDFVDLVNSFYPRNRFTNLKIKLDSQMAIICLENICKNCNEYKMAYDCVECPFDADTPSNKTLTTLDEGSKK